MTEKLSQKILSNVWYCYKSPQNISPALGTAGLTKISEAAGVHPPLIAPRKRATVMILGNHSAGKSSFINYYCGEEVLAASVAVESKGFSIVTHGKARQDVHGEGALVDNEHIAAVIKRPSLERDRRAILENLTKHVRTSAVRDFPSVDFIDTPGLLDGKMTYPFDVNNIIKELASVADLILVFLDPIGQALCSRTMDVVDALEKDLRYSEKMRYFLTKADTVSLKKDGLTKVVAQVSSGLTPHLANTHGFSLPCIWIPQEDEPGQGKALPEVNSLPMLLEIISSTVTNKVQTNVSKTKEDCETLLSEISNVFVAEEKKRRTKASWLRYQVLLAPWFVGIGAYLFLDVLLTNKAHLPASLTGSPLMQDLFAKTEPAMALLVQGAEMAGFVSLGQRLLAGLVAFFVVSLLVSLLRCRSRGLRVRTKEDLAKLREYQGKVEAMRKQAEDDEAAYIRSALTADYGEGGEAAGPSSGGAAITGGAGASVSSSGGGSSSGSKGGATKRK